MSPAEAVARWTPRIQWPEVDHETLVAEALDHVREHQASQAFEHHIPDDLVRRGSPCPRKAVINFIRVEYSSYPLLVERYPRLREVARDRINQMIGRHYAAISCTCRDCP